MKWKWLAIPLLICSFLLGACQSKSAAKKSLPVIENPLIRTESLLHTVVQISIYHENQEEAMEEGLAYVKEMEKLLSTNLEGSDIYRINHAAGKEAIKVDPRTFELIEQALAMGMKSNGRFDVSIGAVNTLWKIGSEDARKPNDQEIKAALPHINYKDVQLDKNNQTVAVKEGMMLELGAISKGYIADGLKKLFASKGITTAIINLGGNVVVMGSSPAHKEGWKVGVQDPDEVRGTVVGSVYVTDGSVVTSGIYERYLEVDGVLYHHILDPETGYPVENTLSGVTVFTKTSTQGDALSTTLFLLGIEKGREFIDQLQDVEAVFIDKDRGIHLSKGLKDRFEWSNKEYHLVND
ncbi:MULTISPECIES: FAD:protein FMN transferase [unclassified Streptococcus]|uniref:FAD:protein FMN transferase n=1 Tax=unclassified Streptococcus TaxID=2608887 RepID=UPI0010724C38|nr:MULTISPECIES: FAD:protein FMN transferase [unclassified Streptococcus]MBF0787591.1 FAD:protein FMN transferase [Streptococcus sp. 19428wC2_LYSM12]MCQ9211978.1 FAD:protein FMN transferase [Streptococcus sp. B01]MCQ9213307.1 FAD:protein FMN transferase [Streptococcus sp. O1]TFV05434.1 FAD:protein FMN transferase [Streptococcus sp. LYSM12]